MRVIVCGGRDYDDREKMDVVLSRILPPYVELINGMAPGADKLAREWAAARGLPIHRYPADWGKNGKAAGPIRNQRMIDHGMPRLVIAFPGGKGTDDMVRRARKNGIEVFVVA